MSPRDYLAELIEHIGDSALNGDTALAAETLGALLGIGQQLRRIADALTAEPCSLPHRRRLVKCPRCDGSGCEPMEGKFRDSTCCSQCHGDGEVVEGDPAVVPVVEKPEPVEVADAIAPTEGVAVRLSMPQVRIDCIGQSFAFLNPAEARQIAAALNAHAAWIEAQR